MNDMRVPHPPLADAQSERSDQRRRSEGMTEGGPTLDHLVQLVEGIRDQLTEIESRLPKRRPLSATDPRLSAQQREDAKRWLIKECQPAFVPEGQPGFKWSQIKDWHSRVGDAPKCSEMTLRRARRGVLDNVREGDTSYWTLRREHVFPTA